MKLMENNCFEEVLSRMLAAVPSNLDKREGSVIYDALAPAALEVSVLYSYIEYLYEQSFAQSADREYLEKLVAPWISPFPATHAKVKAEFFTAGNVKMDIEPGSRFNLDKLNFVARRRMDDGVYELECEEAGTIGNVSEGELIPIEYIENLAKANVVELTERAFEVEDTEHLRERFLRKVREPATSGNIYHYTRWAMEVDGVGAVKIFPLYAGAGTVKVLVINADKELADTGLLEKVYQHIETVRPIGATVTVETATLKNISVSATVVMTAGADIESLKNTFQKVLKDFFKETVFAAEYLSYAKVGNLLLQVPEVMDYSNLVINGAAANVPIGVDEILNLVSLELEG